MNHSYDKTKSLSQITKKYFVRFAKNRTLRDLCPMNSLIKPENIRIYRRANGTYTIKPEGKYVPWLSHFDRLTSLTVSLYPSWQEARKDIESTCQVALPEKLPAYLALESPELPKKDAIPDLNRMTVTVEDLTYLGLHLGTVSIIGFYAYPVDATRVIFR